LLELAKILSSEVKVDAAVELKGVRWVPFIGQI
jgi:hypothetical protein